MNERMEVTRSIWRAAPGNRTVRFVGRFCLVSSTWAHQMSMGKIFSDAQRSERKAKKAPPVARTKEQSFGYGACKGGESMFFPTCTGRLVFINIA